MDSPRLVIFDDAGGRWGPMTDRRPVFELRTGAGTTRQRIERVLGRPAEALWVPPRLVEVARERYSPTVVNPDLPPELPPGSWLLVNGRWNALQHGDRVLALQPGEALPQDDGQLVAACLSAVQVRALIAADWRAAPPGVRLLPPLAGRALLDRPWHVLEDLEAALVADLAAGELPRIERGSLPGDRFPGVSIVGEHPVRIAADARLMPMVVINAEGGPVTIDRGAFVHPFSSLEGPCYVGPGTVLAAHTALRPGTSLGPYCKVGGELSAVVLQGYSNKAHLGYLGNSLVGEWCNLGAGTTASNLKNTYGPVRVQLDPALEPEATGRSAHGPILGDFVRTAIGTRLLTGAVVGTGCMLVFSGYAPKSIAPFVFHTDAGDEAYDVEKFLATVRRMMDRRGLALSAAEADLLRKLHAGVGGNF